MSEKSAKINVSVAPIPGLLGVLFVGLKLHHDIDWSWWWVTAPFWGGFAVAAVAFLFAAIIAIVVAIIGE